MNWAKSFLNEPGTKEGSSQRLLLALLIITILVLVTFLTVKDSKFPDVPVSLFNLVEYIGTLLVFGIGIGKGLSTYKSVKGAANVETPAT